MKIAFLTQGFGKVPDASSITLGLFAKELVKRGNEVVIFSVKEHNQVLNEKINGYRIIRKKQEKNRIKTYMEYHNFSNMIKKEVNNSKKEFDIIHNFSAAPSLAIRALLAKKYSKNAKLIQTIKSASAFTFSYAFTPILNMLDIVTVPTLFLYKKLNKFGLKKSKIRIVESYIDTDKFKLRNKNSLRRKYGFGKEKIVLYYGHLSEKKGIYYLLKAAKLLCGIKILLVTGSTKPYVKPYKQIVENERLDNVKIIEDVKNVEEFVNIADVVVLPYPNLKSTEAQPSCVLETMASKTPLITTNLVELRELVTKKEVVFAKAKDHNDLADKIKKVLVKKDNAKLKLAYKKAKLFDYKKITKKLIKLYQG